MYEQNGIPILALIIEPIVGIGMSVLAVQGFLKYKTKKRDPTLFLALSFVFYSLGVLSSALGKYVDFFFNRNPDLSYADLFIMIAYIFTAVAGCFVFGFVDAVFLNLGAKIVVIGGLLNGITLGLLFTKLEPKPETYQEATMFVVYHAIITLCIVGILAFLSFREVKQNTQKLPKVGFSLIGFYGVFVALTFVLFAIDIATGGDYSPFYYMAWISAGIGTFSGYMGYLLPNWFKKLIKLA